MFLFLLRHIFWRNVLKLNFSFSGKTRTCNKCIAKSDKNVPLAFLLESLICFIFWHFEVSSQITCLVLFRLIFLPISQINWLVHKKNVYPFFPSVQNAFYNILCRFYVMSYLHWAEKSDLLLAHFFGLKLCKLYKVKLVYHKFSAMTLGTRNSQDNT